MKKTSNDLTNKILIETVKTNNFKTNVDLNRLTIIVQAIFFFKFRKIFSSNFITNTAFGPQDTELYQELSNYINAPVNDLTDIKTLDSTVLDITPEQNEELMNIIKIMTPLSSNIIRDLIKKSFSIKEEKIPYSEKELFDAGKYLNNNYEEIKLGKFKFSDDDTYDIMSGLLSIGSVITESLI